jgi:hypothetical protein
MSPRVRRVTTDVPAPRPASLRRLPGPDEHLRTAQNQPPKKKPNALPSRSGSPVPAYWMYV